MVSNDDGNVYIHYFLIKIIWDFCSKSLSTNIFFGNRCSATWKKKNFDTKTIDLNVMNVGTYQTLNRYGIFVKKQPFAILYWLFPVQWD